MRLGVTSESRPTEPAACATRSQSRGEPGRPTKSYDIAHP